MKNSQINSFICFLDILGTKALARTNKDLYAKVIRKFNQIIKKRVDSLYPQISYFVFSDSVYIESADIVELCCFVRKLREDMLQYGICFNAAIRQGSLGIENSFDMNSNIISFTKRDAVKVYSQQTEFTGAGICVDDNIGEYKQVKELLIESIYATVAKDNKFQYHRFQDVKFGLPQEIILTHILQMFLENYILNFRASRYYITMLYTFLNEVWGISSYNKKEELLLITIDALKMLQDGDFKNTLFLMIFNIICNKSGEAHDIEDIINNSIRYFDFICKRVSLHNLYDICSYSSIVINDVNKIVVSRYFTNRLFENIKNNNQSND